MTPSTVDYRQVLRADVFKGDDLAGELRRDQDDVVFEYAADYLARGTVDVATTLPRRSDPYVERSGAVPAFFAGLLPEGRRLSAIQARLKTSADDEFSQLIAVGRDCIGDVRILAFPDADDDTPQMPSGPIDFALLFSQILQNRPLDDRAVPGAQDKISNSMISIPVVGRYGPAIVKLTPAEFPRIVENESFFLGVARDCGLATPRHELIHDETGETALVVERFDRHKTRERIARRAQEDALQLLGRWPSAKYLVTARDMFAAIANVTSAPAVECLKLAKLFALSYVIGNGDLHGKNVSVYNIDGLWRLTPAYDLLSTLPYGDREMAIDLEGRKDNLSSKDLVAVAGRVGVAEGATRKAIDQVAAACARAVPRLEQIGLGEKKTADLSRTIQKRIRDLTG